MGADDRHVAGVVDDAHFLFVGGVVFFIDDDHAEVFIGKEKCGARANDDAAFAGGNTAPCHLALMIG